MKVNEKKVKYHNSPQFHILAVAPETANRILDIGGGTGVTASHLKKHYNAEYVAIFDLFDIPEENKREDINHYEIGNAEHKVAIEELFKKCNQFDLVLCLDVLEHMVDPWTVIEKLHDSLPIGGSIIASIPNIRHVSGFGRIALGTWSYRDSGILDKTHLRFFIKKTAIELCTGTGLKFKGIYSTGREDFRPVYKWLNRLTLGLFKPFFELQYVICVQKTKERTHSHLHGLQSFNK